MDRDMNCNNKEYNSINFYRNEPMWKVVVIMMLGFLLGSGAVVLGMFL